MQINNLIANPWFGKERNGSVLMKNVIIIMLGLLMVSFPPLTYAAHVVSRSGTYRVVRIMPGVTKLNMRVFRHSLYFKGKNFQCVHDCRNTVGYHAEILRAAEHVSSIGEGRQFPHCFAVPEIIVTAVVKIIVQTVEAPALVIVERTICVGKLCRNTRMVFTFFIRIFYKEDLIDKSE